MNFLLFQVPLYMQNVKEFTITATTPRYDKTTPNRRDPDTSNCPFLPPDLWSFRDLTLKPASQTITHVSTNATLYILGGVTWNSWANFLGGQSQVCRFCTSRKYFYFHSFFSLFFFFLWRHCRSEAKLKYGLSRIEKKVDIIVLSKCVCSCSFQIYFFNQTAPSYSGHHCFTKCTVCRLVWECGRYSICNSILVDDGEARSATIQSSSYKQIQCKSGKKKRAVEHIQTIHDGSVYLLITLVLNITLFPYLYRVAM